MPAYLIRHPGGQRDDILIEDPHLALTIQHGWATLADQHGICLAIPTERGAIVQRIDQPPDGNTTSDTTAKGPAPQE
ncbi:hypothetical protein ACIP69_18500 [Streptomyces hygroscopicus]|uniref:hypothetical protein n=1 Tax=Streptomyces hygroscopicus TaxID=1912 RepID=UPI003809180D